MCENINTTLANRIELKKDVSIAKALGIILMVIGHAGCPYYLHDFIYMFHMPLFFFLAGYCFKSKYLSTPKTYVWRKILGLYIPFVVIALLFLLLHNLFVKINFIDSVYYSWSEILDRSKSIVFSMHKEENLIGGFWFIPQLFWASLISYVFLKFFDARIALLLDLSIVVALYYSNFSVPYTAISHVTFYASSFFIIGNMVANQKFNNKWYYIVLTLILVIVASVIMPSGMFCRKGGWLLFPYFLVAVSGSLLIMNVSKIISKTENVLTKALIYIGSKTMWILTLHLICFKLVTLLIIELKSDPIINLRVTPIYNEYSINSGWVIYSAVGVIMPIMLPLIIDFGSKLFSSSTK